MHIVQNISFCFIAFVYNLTRENALRLKGKSGRFWDDSLRLGKGLVKGKLGEQVCPGIFLPICSQTRGTFHPTSVQNVYS